MNVLAVIAIAVGSAAALLGGGAVTYRTVKAQKPIESYALAEAAGPERVLVATHGTKFKDGVMAKLREELAGGQARVDVIDAAKLADADGYDKIVIFSAVQSGKLLPPVASYLNARSDFRNVRLVLTADSGDWKAREFDIDAVTTASRTGNETGAAAALKRAILEPVR